jgi:hypothetical protein
MRVIQLRRHEDVTGASGTGIVADGVEFADGTVALRWFGEHRSTVVWSNIHSAIAVHGHDGRTIVEALIIICPSCRRGSANPGDIEHGWCSACKVTTSPPWHGDESITRMHCD